MSAVRGCGGKYFRAILGIPAGPGALFILEALIKLALLPGVTKVICLASTSRMFSHGFGETPQVGVHRVYFLEEGLPVFIPSSEVSSGILVVESCR